MTFVEPVTLRDRGVRLEPLDLSHEPGLAAAAADGELWKIRVTSVPEPGEVRSYIEAALLGRDQGHRFAFAVLDAASGKVLGSKVDTEWKPVRQTAVSLERAIQIAQGKIQGRVMEAERDRSLLGQVVYKVDILAANNVPHKVVVDASNGRVLASYVDYND